MSGNLGIAAMTAGQGGKPAKTNADLDAIARAFVATFSADLSAGNVALTDAQYRLALTVRAINAPSPGRTVTLAQIERLALLVVDGSCLHPVRFVRGSSSVPVPPGGSALVRTDGSANGLAVLQRAGADVTLDFTSSGTFDPVDYPGLSGIYVRLAGGGGGGGGGSCGQVAGTNYGGGAGGGGASVADVFIPASGLTSALTITLGAGGAGGAGALVAETDGLPGAVGGTSSVTMAGDNILVAYGGGGGGQGRVGNSTNGGGGAGAGGAGGTGGAAVGVAGAIGGTLGGLGSNTTWGGAGGRTQPVGSSGNTGITSVAAGAGGAGGGGMVSLALRVGGGGAFPTISGNSLTGGPAGGVLGGNADGQNGFAVPGRVCGTSGGGGASVNTSTPSGTGRGGNGFRGSGGGGGGAGTGRTSGAGGDGGAGWCTITVVFDR